MGTPITDYTAFTNFINQHPKSIIMYTRQGCRYCTQMFPVVDEYQRSYSQVAFAMLDINTMPIDDLQGAPTFVGYRYGQPVNVVVGADPNGLRELIHSL